MTKESDKVSVLGISMKKSSTLIIKKTIALGLLSVSSIYAMELPPKVAYEKNSQKSFKAQLMSNKIDECFKYIEGQKEKNKHYCTLASEALTCINRPESLLSILKHVEALLGNSPSSCRLIHLAAEYNDLELLRYLKKNQMVIGFAIDKVINVNDSKGNTPIFYAVRGNALEAMKLLKEWGAVIDANPHDQGVTPLHAACKANAIEAMMLLKDWGADINAITYRYETPLHLAARANAIEAMKLLILWGADINQKTYCEGTPLHYAAEANALEAMELLLDRGAYVSEKTLIRKETPLHYAATGNAIEAMNLLKDCGADINAKADSGVTPLHYAAERNAIGAIKLLKEWGADINAKANPGVTPFHLAANGNAIEAMKLLKYWGADIHEKTGSGETAFHCAADGNAIEAMVLLLGWGVNMEEKEEGNTSLALAIRYDKKESMDFLCFLGANKDLVNAALVHKVTRDGFGCFKFICKINQMKPSQSLDAKDGMKLLHEAVDNGLFCCVRKLLSLGQIKEVNQKNDAGYTILHRAAINNVANVVKILLTTPEIDPYSRTYGTLEKCPACKAQTPYEKMRKTHPGKGCQACGSQTPYDLASPEIKQLYDEMRERIAIICYLKKLGLPKELAYIIFRLSNYAAKHTHMPKGLFHKQLKLQEQKQKLRKNDI